MKRNKLVFLLKHNSLKKVSVLNRAINFFKYAILTLSLIFIVIIGIVNLPFVHKFLTGKTNEILEKKGIPLHIGKIALLLNGKIGISELALILPENDTILYAGKLSVDVSPLSLLSKKVKIKGIILNNAVANIFTDTITGELRLIQAFEIAGTNENDQYRELKPEKSSGVWDIQVKNVTLKNIRFVYSSPSDGVFLRQNLAKAEICFKTFSLLKQNIEIERADISKPVGLLEIVGTDNKQDYEDTTGTKWNISPGKIEIDHAVFALKQPDAGKHINVKLKKALFSTDKFDLKSQTIIAGKLIVDEPEVTIVSIGESRDNNVQPDSRVEFELPVIPWSVIVKKAVVSNGFFALRTDSEEQNTATDQWLPVTNINVVFDNIELTPEGYKINLDKLALTTGNTLEIESGLLNFQYDFAQNLNLEIDLSGLLKHGFKQSNHKTGLHFGAKLSGSTKALDLNEMVFKTSDGLQFNLQGTLLQPMQMPNSVCDISFKTGAPLTHTQLLPLLSTFAPGTDLPRFSPATISGNVGNTLMYPTFGINIKSQSGNFDATGRFDINNKRGEIQALFSQIRASALFGESLPEYVTGSLNVRGGLEPNNIPEGEMQLQIDSVRYYGKTIHNISLKAETKEKAAVFLLLATDSTASIDLTGNIDWKQPEVYSAEIKGIFGFDLYKLNFMPETFFSNGAVEAGFRYSPKGMNASAWFRDLEFKNNSGTSSVNHVVFNLDATDSLINADFNAGFFKFRFTSNESFEGLTNALSSFKFDRILDFGSPGFINKGVVQQLKPFRFEAELKHHPVFSFLFPGSTLGFDDVAIDFGKKENDSIATGTITTKWVNFNEITIYQPEISFMFKDDKIAFGFFNDSIIFDKVKFGQTSLKIDAEPKNIGASFSMSDNKGKLLHNIGFNAEKTGELVHFQSATPAWLINGNTWNLLQPRFLTWNNTDKSLLAGLELNHEGHFIGFNGKNTENLQLDLKKIDLKSFIIPGIIDFLPEGTLNATLRYAKTKTDNLEFGIELENMKWEGLYLNLLTAHGKLIADSAGIRESEMIIGADNNMAVRAEITSDNESNAFRVKSRFSNLQFGFIEPFISEYVKNLHGIANGELQIFGKDKKTLLDGEIRIKDFGVKIVPLEATFSFPENKIEIRNNDFVFHNFMVADSLNRTLAIDGKITFETPEKIWAGLKIKTDKILLMNTSETDNAAFFGSIVVNSELNINGLVFSPDITGKIELENGTNLTYQLVQDFTVQNNQTDVVFALITDSLTVIYPENQVIASQTKMPRIEASIGINPKTVFNVKISDIYGVDITVGGYGLLNYNMLPNNTMSLSGLYEINSGECKLKITGWPLKDFAITPGSSLRWDGSIENPELNIGAAVKVKGNYFNPIDNRSRAVDFVVTMQIKNRLSELHIDFGIQSADQYINSIISSFSDDEIMRQAINLLLFETIDIPGIESSGNYLSSQINSFWESQLNALSGSALKKTKLSFGIGTRNQNTESGMQEKTNFTYEMERKFWNDRATLKLSGRLNDYEEGAYRTNSIFENFIFEYSLDAANTKLLKLYQQRDYEDMLEGEVIKYGAGFLYRKNYSRLKDIWQRGKKERLTKKTTTGNKP